LDDLARRFRDGIATTLGEAVSGVCHALLEAPGRPYRPPRRYWPERSWDREGYWPDRYEEPYEDEEQEYPTAAEPPDPAPPPQARWLQAVALALQAACWWLHRPPCRYPLATGLGVATLTGLAAYAGAPLVAGVLALAGTALGVVALLDRACAEANALAETV